VDLKEQLKVVSLINMAMGNINIVNAGGSGNIVFQDVKSSNITIGDNKNNEPKEKILFLAVNPTDQARIQTDVEYNYIFEQMGRRSKFNTLNILHAPV
jgi:hypothetical protein